MGIEKRIHIAAVLIGLFGAACGDLRGVFESSVNATHHRTQSEKTRPAGRGKPSVSTKSARLSDDAPDRGEIRETIVTRQGAYYFVHPGDTLARISDKFNADWEDIAQINGLYDSDLLVGRRLFIPNKKTIAQYIVVNRVISEDRSPTSKSKPSEFAWPIESPRVSSPFGFRRRRNHDGIDISAKVGTPILAAEDGRVIYAKRMSTYGNLIVIKHAGGYFTAYAHSSELFVRPGQLVKRGQKISLVGLTGRTYGSHLHFEVHSGPRAIDPQTVLPKL